MEERSKMGEEERDERVGPIRYPDDTGDIGLEGTLKIRG